MNYNLTKPCDNCPFRADKLFYLRPQRIKEIVNTGNFACHKTVDYSNEEPELKDKSEHCAGLLIMLEHMEQPHQMMRISERLGVYDRTKLDMSQPVYKDVTDYIERLEKE